VLTTFFLKSGITFLGWVKVALKDAGWFYWLSSESSPANELS
jgi:hypothetical protein